MINFRPRSHHREGDGMHAVIVADKENPTYLKVSIDDSEREIVASRPSLLSVLQILPS